MNVYKLLKIEYQTASIYRSFIPLEENYFYLFVLDMDASWLAGKRIAVFDDALITGTTVCKTILKLTKMRCTVSVHVLCINESWWCRDLVMPEQPHLVLSDQHCASICANIVDAISTVPLPYSTDFPFFPGMRIERNALEALMRSPYWSSFDNTTNLQSSLGIVSQTFEPTSESKKQLESLLGRDLETGEIVKVRLYGRPFSNNQSQLWCCILPIICLNPMGLQELENISGYLFDLALKNGFQIKDWFRTKSKTSVEDRNSRRVAKLRLIHYLASIQLAKCWLNSLSLTSGFELKQRPEEQSLCYLFPHPMVSPIIELAQRDLVVFPPSQTPQSIKQYQTEIPLGDSKLRGDDAWSVEERLIGLFRYLYDKYELPARHLAFQHGREAFHGGGQVKSKYKNHMGRLEKGYSLPDLCLAINHPEWSQETIAQMVSRFLDRMVDRGIIVPITCVSGELVYRAYRHGEDVHFGRSEIVTLQWMLNGYQRSSNSRTAIPGIEIEKLSVLTVKELLNSGLLVRPEKNMLGVNGTIGVRFSLHGAVIAEKCSHIYDAPSERCIRNILVDADVLCKNSYGNDENARYTVKPLTKHELEAISVKAGALEEAETIGLIYGYLRSRGRKRVPDKLTQWELTCLATTTSTRDICGALGAEINFIVRGFNRFTNRFHRGINDSRYLNDLVSFIRNTRQNFLFVALHSGRKKYP